MGYYRDPTPAELANVYENAWKDPNLSGSFAAGSTSPRIAESLVRLVSDNPPALGSCLDYGGGQGALAAVLAAHGVADVSILEPFGDVREGSGVTWIKSWEDLPAGKRFDWIFMVEVLEHLPDPEKELRELRERLTPTGGLFLTTPNARGWRARTQSTRWREAQNPTHLNLFSAQALSTCLRRAGFTQTRRLFKPVRYNSKGIAAVLLGLTQLIGVDGGLRVIAR